MISGFPMISRNSADVAAKLRQLTEMLAQTIQSLHSLNFGLGQAPAYKYIADDVFKSIRR